MKTHQHSLAYARYGVCRKRDDLFVVSNRKDTTIIAVNAEEKFLQLANNMLDTTAITHLRAVEFEKSDATIAMCNPHGFICPTCLDRNRVFGVCDKPECASQRITRHKTQDDGSTDVVVFNTGNNFRMLIHADGTFERQGFECTFFTFTMSVSDVLLLMDTHPSDCEQIAQIVARDIQLDQHLYEYPPNSLDSTCAEICLACKSVQNVLLLRFTTLHASRGSGRLGNHQRKTIWM
jgi:hypothetical protein